MSTAADTAWAHLQQRIAELEALAGAQGILEWDQQVWMPPGGAPYRGAQSALLSGLTHERTVDPKVAEWLAVLEADPATATDPVRRAAVRNVGRRHRLASEVPASLVRALAEATSRGFQAWLAARKDDDFSVFEPALTELVELTRQKAACHGSGGHPYDHLLAEYDPGSTTADLTAMFDRLGRELADFVSEVAEAEAAGRGPRAMAIPVSTPVQDRINRRIVEAMGFDMQRGRLDFSEHPFTMGVGPGDVRLTTHIHEDDLLSSLGGTIHECGHGLYEQGLPEALAGTSVREPAGFGIHESQSRFWENFIGRSRPFCGWLAGLLTEELGADAPSADQLYAASNRVQRSLIRIEADEATYNLHIIARFQLETALVSGDLSVADVAGAWDEGYRRLLGIRAPSARKGVLQDVHWSSGLFGYFPSYTIGNLYASSFAVVMQADLPGMWDEVRRGEFASVLEWLRARVHRRGHDLEPPEIFTEVVGDRDPVADLVAHLRGRHGALYGLT